MSSKKCPFCGSLGGIGPLAGPNEYIGGYLCKACRSIHNVPHGNPDFLNGHKYYPNAKHFRSTNKLINAAKQGERAIQDY